MLPDQVETMRISARREEDKRVLTEGNPPHYTE